MNCDDTCTAGQASTTAARAIHNSARAIHRNFSELLRTFSNILEHLESSIEDLPLFFTQTLLSVLSTKFSHLLLLKTLCPSHFHLCEDLLSRAPAIPSEPIFYLSLTTTVAPPNGHCPSAADRALSQRGGGCNSSCSRSFFALHFPRVFFTSLSFPSRVLDTDLPPTFLATFSAFPFAPPSPRVTRSTVRVCSRRRSALSLTHTCTLSRSRVHALISHSLSFYRSCVLSSKHSHRSLVSIRIPRETIVESLTVVSRASL
jgi:hypothetical protein